MSQKVHNFSQEQFFLIFADFNYIILLPMNYTFKFKKFIQMNNLSAIKASHFLFKSAVPRIAR